MKKSFIIAAFIVTSCLIACQVNEPAPVQENEAKLVEKIFTVSVLDTKTTLDGKKVKWSDNDKINVIGITADGTVYQHDDFIIASGQNSSSATFTGTVNADEETFYAVYPNYAIDETKIKDGIVLTEALPLSGDNMQQKGYADGFDPEYGVMVATADANGNLAFKHAMSYFKFQIGESNISKVTFSTTGDIRFGSRIQYTLASDAVDTQSAKKVVDLTPAVGTTFVKDATYYLAFPPRAGKKIKQLTITYTQLSGVSQSIDISNNAFLQKSDWTPGTIVNIGCPPISFTPSIAAADVIIAATDEGGTITYTVNNEVSGGVLTAAIQDAGTISNLVLGTPASGSLTFTCDANTETTAKTATVRLTYTYNDPAETVIKDVVINQAPYGGSLAPETHVRVYYNGNTECLDGTTVSSSPYYFSHSTNYVALNSSASNGGGMDSFDIPGTTLTSTSSLKLDGSGNLSFTTSSTLNSSVSFYYTKRSSGSGKIQITPEGGTATVYSDASYGTVSSHTLSLEKNTQYTINRNSGELLLLAVVVNETSE